MSKEKEMAKEILDKVGGKDNLEKVIHCMTRVRMSIVDYTKVDIEGLKNIKGVMGVVEDDMIQVVVGPGTVNKVANEMSSIIGVPLGETIKKNQSNKEKVEQEADLFKQNINKKNQTPFKRVLRSIANIFVPLIPAFVGAGLIGGISAVLSNLLTAGTIDGASWEQFVLVFNIIKDGLFAYLVIYVGINAAKEFGATPGLGGVIGGTTMLTGMDPESPLKNIFNGEPLEAGQGGVIGVIIAVWLLSLIEKRLHKIVPTAVDIIVTPTITLFIMGLGTIFVIMPIAGFISNGLLGVIDWVLNIGGAFSGFILGATFLPLVMFGLHQVLTPIHIEMINQSGATYLLPILAMAGAGQVGAAFALWVRCRKNKKIINLLKGALPVGILGIGEPLIYGVTLPLGRPFITACIGGGVGGAVIGAIGHIGASAIGPSGVSLIPLISHNMYVGYIAGLLAAYLGGFIFTYLFGTNKEMTAPQELDED
ncbi:MULTISPECIES: PTS transporter subunit EIIC [Mammaliicoccus]|uniref:PTS system MurNAc-GlcNAc-specific EIIBC component n=1 Tax=Mammaliicoccus lentus TaxID=42858 RepID=A0ABS6H1Y1_MAMLE|nr:MULTISPECIES: PTS transporter subunit EIIC [Mammaliicoccus]MBF0749619.1 PTS transporter subunit EIIC [Mammaliicoccus lentus]MBF0841062.1 PTS transporter subunit EIIC [Mammaliicoccus lentus]MBU6114798.1 PTS transporter subunit EIIC [Mammaliicoccus lentus]MEB8092715.1 PTS transporter subunit EIIC [Mammaliicoccus lentus]QMU11948.1 PTS transporter subunit EIIC [Mammaliicoccus lentus]